MTPKSEMSFPGTLHVHHIAMMMAGIEKAGKDLNKAYLRGYASILIDSEVIRVPFSFAVATDMSVTWVLKHSQVRVIAAFSLRTVAETASEEEPHTYMRSE